MHCDIYLRVKKANSDLTTTHKAQGPVLRVRVGVFECSRRASHNKKGGEARAVAVGAGTRPAGQEWSLS